MLTPVNELSCCVLDTSEKYGSPTLTVVERTFHHAIFSSDSSPVSLEVGPLVRLTLFNFSSNSSKIEPDTPDYL